MKFISINQELWIPTDIATCPVCRAMLSAIPDSFEQVFPSVNLFLARSTQRVSCLKSEKHESMMLEEWFKIHDRIDLWLQLGSVAIELGPESHSSEEETR